MRTYSYSREKERKGLSLILKAVFYSITVVSFTLNLNVYLQHGNNYQVFLGPSELYKTLDSQIRILSSELSQANTRIKELEEIIRSKDANILSLRDEIRQRDKEIERLSHLLGQVQLRLIKVTGSIIASCTPVEIIFKEANGEHRFKVSGLNGKYIYEATLENNKAYAVTVAYEARLFIIPLGIRESTSSIPFLLTSNTLVFHQDFKVSC